MGERVDILTVSLEGDGDLSVRSPEGLPTDLVEEAVMAAVQWGMEHGVSPEVIVKMTETRISPDHTSREFPPFVLRGGQG